MSAEDKSINISASDMDVERDFWDDIIMRQDGTLSPMHVYQELHDYRFLMDQASNVYHYVTCGQLSKPGYMSDDVIRVSDACTDIELRALVNQVLDHIEEGVSIDELRAEYPDPRPDDPSVVS